MVGQAVLLHAGLIVEGLLEPLHSGELVLKVGTLERRNLIHHIVHFLVASVGVEEVLVDCSATHHLVGVVER